MRDINVSIQVIDLNDRIKDLLLEKSSRWQQACRKVKNSLAVIMEFKSQLHPLPSVYSVLEGTGGLIGIITNIVSNYCSKMPDLPRCQSRI
jgi:hypothetical protein